MKGCRWTLVSGDKVCYSAWRYGRTEDFFSFLFKANIVYLFSRGFMNMKLIKRTPRFSYTKCCPVSRRVHDIQCSRKQQGEYLNHYANHIEKLTAVEESDGK